MANKMLEVAVRNYKTWSDIWAMAYKAKDNETMKEAKEEKEYWLKRIDQLA